MEIAKKLGMGANILDAGSLGEVKHQESAAAAESIEKADGFAQVFPEHKFHKPKPRPGLRPIDATDRQASLGTIGAASPLEGRRWK
ncbi:MAG: hypothetical protein WCF20_13475 [Methylovirgula sp.]